VIAKMIGAVVEVDVVVGVACCGSMKTNGADWHSHCCHWHTHCADYHSFVALHRLYHGHCGRTSFPERTDCNDVAVAVVIGRCWGNSVGSCIAVDRVGSAACTAVGHVVERIDVEQNDAHWQAHSRIADCDNSTP